jgi:hypothetical protein
MKALWHRHGFLVMVALGYTSLAILSAYTLAPR